MAEAIQGTTLSENVNSPQGARTKDTKSLSFASTRTGSSAASTEVTSSDSDSSSVHSRLKVKEGLKEAKEIAKEAVAARAAIEATLSEPMKVELGSYPNTNHPEIENILSLQQLQTDLESSLQKLVKQELLAKAAGDATAWQQQLFVQHYQQTQQALWESGYQAACAELSVTGGPPGNFEPDSPLVPYLMAELTSGTPPPMPGFGSHWGMQYPAAFGGHTKKSSKKVTTALSRAAEPFVPTAPKTQTPKVTSSDQQNNRYRHDIKFQWEGDAESDQHQSKESLEEMRNADHARTVVATKINRLGFSAEKMLKEHFAQFGKIDHVCVPHKIKRVQGTAASPGHSHLRPSGLGFIVMDTEEEAQAILAAGAEQIVCGKPINVRSFKQGQTAVAEEPGC